MTTVTFKGTPVHLAGTFLNLKQKAPSFTLVGSGLEDITLESLPAVKKLLLIVPSLETSVCATCTRTFHAKVANRKDLLLLVISADLPFAQKRYCDTEKFSNLTTLSTMRDQSFAKDYGVLIQEGPLKGLCARAVLLLDETNNVIYEELVSEITSEPNYDKVFSCI
jgi:thiol peroxidase